MFVRRDVGAVMSENTVTPPTMRAWVVDSPGPIDEHPLVLVERAVPEPGPGEVRVQVLTCGVCRTDLHLAEGDLAPRRPQVTPGHEVVGIVDALGEGADRFALGERVGVPWLAHTCGVCRFCTSARENLCIAPRFTGWDVDGGYAEYLVVEERVRVRVARPVFADIEAAPLLCAGIIGYRVLAPGPLPAGRPARHLRLRRVRAPHRPGRDRGRTARARDDARRRSAGARAGARRAERGRRGGPAARNRSTRRSCSRPSARSYRPRSKRSTAAERSRSRASTSPTSRR